MEMIMEYYNRFQIITYNSTTDLYRLELGVTVGCTISEVQSYLCWKRYKINRRKGDGDETTTEGILGRY